MTDTADIAEMADITATTLPAVSPILNDGFRMLAGSAPIRRLRGDLIKFRKGLFPVGRDEGDMLGSVLAPTMEPKIGINGMSSAL